MSLVGYPRPFAIPSLNTLGSFVSELCCRQTDRQTDRTRTSYSRRPTYSARIPISHLEMYMNFKAVIIIIVVFVIAKSRGTVAPLHNPWQSQLFVELTAEWRWQCIYIYIYFYFLYSQLLYKKPKARM